MIRGKVGVIVALLVAVGLALSALAGLGSRSAAIPAEGPWLIGLERPEGGWSACLDDPALTEGFMSADEPVSAVTVQTVPGATVADVRRVADCLSRTMTGGSAHIRTAAR